MPPVPWMRTTASTVRQISSELAPRFRHWIGQAKNGYPTREPVTRRSQRGNSNRLTAHGEGYINGFLDAGSIPAGSTKKTMENDTFPIVFFIHCESNGISSPLGVYHHRRCISSTVGCISFAMMIYSSENEICSFSNGWYAISMKLVIYKATPWFVCESVIQ